MANINSRVTVYKNAILVSKSQIHTVFLYFSKTNNKNILFSLKA